MPERRYSDEEAAEIFGRAARAEESAPRGLVRAEGMTLAELQEAGREAGIAPERIADAARELAVSVPPETRRFLGVTIGVGRSVELGRRLDDDEWERVVVLLRETFDARGTLRSHGSLREWTNGNLQALLEPGERGHRLRLRTTHGSARALLTAGLGLATAAAVLAVSTAATIGFRNSDPVEQLGGLVLLGAGAFGAGLLRLRGWARTRREQFDEIARRLAAAGRP